MTSASAASGASSAPAPLAHDQLELHLVTRLGIRGAAHHDRLEHPDLADGVHQLVELVLVEDRARLARVGHDRIERDLRELRSGHGSQAAGIHVDGCGVTPGAPLLP